LIYDIGFVTCRIGKRRPIKKMGGGRQSVLKKGRKEGFWGSLHGIKKKQKKMVFTYTSGKILGKIAQEGEIVRM